MLLVVVVVNPGLSNTSSIPEKCHGGSMNRDLALHMYAEIKTVNCVGGSITIFFTVYTP